jgi:PTH2 family peptidyl-tRNA hydrolase
MPVINHPYDLPEKPVESSAQIDPVVMYLIVHASLGMSPGKLAAQAGHAVGMVMLHYADHRNEDTPENKLMRDWITSSYRKVTLAADDKEWEKVKSELNCFLVRDAGYTELSPGSETVIALYPMLKSQRSKLLKRLQTLK